MALPDKAAVSDARTTPFQVAAFQALKSLVE
jgi:hypothetical protein